MLKTRFLLRIVLILTLSIYVHSYGWAQPWPDNNGGGIFGNDNDNKPEAAGDPGDPGEDPDLPIDTNVLVLVAAGVAYGLKKRWDSKKALKKEKNTLQHTTLSHENL